MRRFAAVLALAVLGATALAACRQYLPTNRYLRLRERPAESESTADARRLFDHDRHAKAFATGNVTCVDCHAFTVRIDTENEELARVLSAQAQVPGSAACHGCHGSGTDRMGGAPTACMSCHENLAPLRPENHEIVWERVHASVSRADPTSCLSCHRSAECIDCHQRRDTIQERVHERNFLFFHSVAARANPMQCGSCHRQDFCRNCHERGILEVEP